MRRKRVLLVWWDIDNRPEFLDPFIKMSNDIEFILLIYKTKKENPGRNNFFKMIYWFDYLNAQRVLQDIKPDMILGITEGFFSAALINASKEYKIPFYGLQHGYSHENITQITLDRKQLNWEKIYTYIRSTLFFIMSFSIFKTRKFFNALYYYWLYLRTNTAKLLRDNNFTWLVPDYYICFSEYSASHYKEIYKLANERIKYTGIVWFDDLFQKTANLAQYSEINEQKYFLLIDTSFAEYNKPVSQLQINRCYHILSSFCEAHSAKLKIKLHPFNYQFPDPIRHPNIEFIRNLNANDLPAIIAGCEGCFGFYSTLTFPIIAIKPVIQISYDGIYLKWPEEKGLTPVIDFYSFTKEDIHFYDNEILEEHHSDLEYLLYKTDGEATNRLRQIILTA